MAQIRQYFLKITADPSFHRLLPIMQNNTQLKTSRSWKYLGHFIALHS